MLYPLSYEGGPVRGPGGQCLTPPGQPTARPRLRQGDGPDARRTRMGSGGCGAADAGQGWSMAVAAVVLVLVVLVGLVLVRRRKRRAWRGGPEAADRAVRAQVERVEVQRRTTRMHPDFVRDWMRPR